MIEEAIYAELVSCGSLVEYLSTHNSRPAVFLEEAPEDAELPYIINVITELSTENLSAKEFNVYVNYYDEKKSRVNCIAACKEIEHLFEQAVLESNDYDSIRLTWESAGFVPSLDPRKVHRNIQFTARAGRKAWCEQL